MDATAGDFEAKLARLDCNVKRSVRKYSIPGIALACFEQEQEGLISAGQRENGLRDSVNEQTTFAAASLGKPVLAYIVMRLREQGQIDIDLPIVKYGSYPDVENLPGHHRVTPRSLLCHRSGLPNDRHLHPLSLHPQAEGPFRYSGEGYLWLQWIVERITDSSLDELARRLVFTPLDMQRSGYTWRSEFDANHAVPHACSTKPRPKKIYTQPSAMNSLATTSADYLAFLREIIDPCHISEESIAEMFQPQVRVASRNLGRHRLDWGLGFGLQSVSNGSYEAWHWGNLGGERSYFVISKSERRGLVYFTNSANGYLCTSSFTDIIPGTPQIGYRWKRLYPRSVYRRLRSLLDNTI